jgi:tetratricopeptide (TPR) repeat protein
VPRSRLAILSLAVAACAAAAQGADDARRICRNSDPDLRIRACTSIIESATAKIADRADAYRNRGLAYALDHDLDRAFADYDRAIEIEPGNPHGFFVRGSAFHERKEDVRAIADYSRAIALDPRYTVALSNRATAYRRVGDHAKAIADYDRLIALDPNGATSWVERGATYFEARQDERGLQDYDQAVRIAGEYAWPWSARCWARGVAGRLQEALADCNTALRIDPNEDEGTNQSAFANRGVVRLKLKDYDAAIADFDASLSHDPHLARALYGRGIARSKTGDAKGGEADLAAAISIWADIAGEFARWGLDPGAL